MFKFSPINLLLVIFFGYPTAHTSVVFWMDALGHKVESTQKYNPPAVKTATASALPIEVDTHDNVYLRAEAEWENGNEAAIIDFIGRFSPIVKEEANKFGLPASVILAHAIYCSSAGKSPMALEVNNYFNTKCKSHKCGSGHCKNYQEESAKDFFIVYKSAWASFRANSLIMAKSPKLSAFRNAGGDYRRAVHELSKKVTGNSNGAYENVLIGIIIKYKLDEL